MNIGRFFWGIIVIFIGLVFLLINFGFLNSSVWADLWRLWPIILIIIGLSVISKSLSLVGQIILNIITLAILVLALVFILTPNNRYSSRVFQARPSVTSQTQQISEELSGKGNPLQVTIKTGAGQLNISDSTDKFVTGTLESDVSKIEISKVSTNKEDRIELASNVQQGIGFNFRQRNRLNLSLNGQLPLSLELQTGALEGNLNLSELNLKNLLIKSGASSYNVTLGDKSDKLEGEFNIGASSIVLNIPQAAGLKIISKSGLSSNNFTQQGLTKLGDSYISAYYDQAPKKIDLTFKAGASSIDLNRI